MKESSEAAGFPLRTEVGDDGEVDTGIWMAEAGEGQSEVSRGGGGMRGRGSHLGCEAQLAMMCFTNAGKKGRVMDGDSALGCPCPPKARCPLSPPS